jgi:hypothetical protein
VLFNVDGNSKDYIVLVVGEWMCLEHWWNDSDGGKKNQSTLRKTCQCHFVHHKSQMDWLGIELGPSQ